MVTVWTGVKKNEHVGLSRNQKVDRGILKLLVNNT